MKIINLNNVCDDRVIELRQAVQHLRKAAKKMLNSNVSQDFNTHCMIKDIYNTLDNRIAIEYIGYTAKVCNCKATDNSTLAEILRSLDISITLAVLDYTHAVTAIEGISSAYGTATHDITKTLILVIQLAHAIKRKLN